MKRALVTLVLLISAAFPGIGQTVQSTSDVLGMHDLAPGGSSPLRGMGGSACQYCHAPHSGAGGQAPLWSQTLSTQTYTMYSGPTLQNTAVQPVVGAASSLCLSCHDGTVAVGTSVPSGKMAMTGSMYATDVFGTNLQSSHPFSFRLPLRDSSNLVSGLVSSGTTSDPTNSVRLINGNVECTTCHNPHVQNLDSVAFNFLVRDNSNGGICLSCHGSGARTVNGMTNPLMGWSTSIHATAANTVATQANFGAYSTVAQFACSSCHLDHNAGGPANLLRNPIPPLNNYDATTQACMTCHNGGSNLTPAAPNVGAEMLKVAAHPTPTAVTPHSSIEPAVLQSNRHATCVDCHNAHDSLQVTTFPPAPAIRISQNGVAGVSASDGTTVVNPAVNQYENCLRCHGTSSGKQLLPSYIPLRLVAASDRLNVIPELAATTTSSHPVTHDSSSPYPQPSLRTYQLNLDGVTLSTRLLGTGTGARILCTDCHNSDDNREFGGSGANGPHGSANAHILERRYEFTQAAMPGVPVNQLWPNPSLTSGGAAPGPYALCGKCHDLGNIMTDASFQPNASTGQGGHNTHINYGFSCSVCHAAHGMGSQSPNISGERLVDFDANVVGALGTSPISYNRSANTCTLVCHGYAHNGSTVTAVP